MVRPAEAEAEEVRNVVAVIREVEEEIQQLVEDFKERNKISAGPGRGAADLDISGYQHLTHSVSTCDSAVSQAEADTQLFASQSYLESIIDGKIDSELERVQSSIASDLSMEESLRKMEQTLALLLHTSQMRPLYAK